VIYIVFINDRIGRKLYQHKGSEATKCMGKVMSKDSGEE
jgi:hypothetical protein